THLGRLGCQTLRQFGGLAIGLLGLLELARPTGHRAETEPTIGQPPAIFRKVRVLGHQSREERLSVSIGFPSLSQLARFLELATEKQQGTACTTASRQVGRGSNGR